MKDKTAVSDKISPAFDDRLRHLAPQQRTRAIILLDATVPPHRRGERSAAIASLQRALAPVLDEIDGVLARTGGQRLAPEVDALGTVLVETTAAGTRALAALPLVKAIIDDQPVSALK